MPYPLREFAYWMTRYRHTWRASAVFSLLNPLLFLAGIGAGLGKLVNAGGRTVDGVPYAAYVAPGLLAASAMQTAFTESAQGAFAALRTKRSYRISAAGPLEPGDILVGHMLYVLFRVTSTSAVFVAVAAALGVIGPAGALWTIPAAALTGMAFALPAAAWAVVVRRSASLTLFFRFVIFPLYMFSGTFFDLDMLPRWLRDTAYATPLYHGVALCRDLALAKPPSAAMALELGYLCALLCAGAVLAGFTYRRALHDH